MSSPLRGITSRDGSLAEALANGIRANAGIAQEAARALGAAIGKSRTCDTRCHCGAFGCLIRADDQLHGPFHAFPEHDCGDLS